MKHLKRDELKHAALVGPPCIVCIEALQSPGNDLVPGISSALVGATRWAGRWEPPDGLSKPVVVLPARSIHSLKLGVEM